VLKLELAGLSKSTSTTARSEGAAGLLDTLLVLAVAGVGSDQPAARPAVRR
jgi:hypothetical protein